MCKIHFLPILLEDESRKRPATCLIWGFEMGSAATEKDYRVGEVEKDTKKAESFSFVWGVGGAEPA